MAETATRARPANRAREELVARIMAAPAAVALVVASANFLMRGSGIAWTAGAGLAVFGCAALTLAALLVGQSPPGAWRTVLVVLILIGGLLTALAAWFLDSPLVLAAMLATLACWLLFVLVAR